MIRRSGVQRVVSWAGSGLPASVEGAVEAPYGGVAVGVKSSSDGVAGRAWASYRFVAELRIEVASHPLCCEGVPFPFVGGNPSSAVE